MSRPILGLTERVVIYGKKRKQVIARIDTGAQKNSICTSLASQLELGPVLRTVRIRSATGRQVRPVVKAKMKIGPKLINASFSLADRTHMKYDLLIGTNTLKKGFLIDPSKK
ncbi:ATP-dependent zinc protease [Candidatus Woesearchaeota archaeon]|nr:ATP-dependent zinc protease [Candidatus Woesearchaeota archaeon]